MNDRWKRFGLTDCAVLIVALAIGMGSATLTSGENWDRSDPTGSRRMIWFLSGALWSSVFAGTFVLISQRFRGRDAPLSSGEWLWIVTIVLTMAFFAISPFVCVIQCLFSVVAIAWLYGVWKNDLSSRWTSLLGGIICLTAGPSTAWILYMGLSQL